MNYEDARNSLPLNDGMADHAAHLVPEIAAAAATVGRGAIPLLVNADNVVTLPPGASLDDIQVRGRDLVIEMPDGRVFVIVDGAVFVPTIVADGVAIPPLNLAAYLNSSEIQPAAGTPQSSGGNFADPNDPLQPAYGLGDLLPYTELSFPQPQDEEVIPGLVNRQPAIIFVPEIGEGTEVREAHLPSTTPTRNNESPGSQFDGNSESTSNVIRFISPDGVESVRINGVVLTPGSFPQVVASDATGTLTITGYTFDEATSTGTISYTYTLNDNTVAPEGSDVTFPIVVTDPQGDSATDDLIIDIIDDVPEAFDNTNSVSEGGTATGNVLTDQVDDIFGADGPVGTTPEGGVVGVRAAGGNTTTEVVGGTGTQIAGLYGTLTLNANGTYTYVAKPNFINANVSEVFVYTIEDGDGDRSTATLTIDIAAVGGSSSDNDARVDESGLDGIGSQIVPNGEFFTGGQITVTGASGPFTYTLTSPANGTYGNLVLNAATGAYSYTLDTPFDEPDANNGRDTINDAETFGYEVTDQNGNIVGTGTIDIDIVDDVPTAFPNFNSVAEGGTVGGDVLLDQGADVFGADGRAATNPAGGVIGVRAANGDTTTHVVGGTGTQIAGLHGTLTLNANGTYSYTANANLAGSGLEDLFVYTIQDGDGDRSTTTLRISIDEINLVADNDRVVTREDALDLFQTGADLAPGTVTGSDPGSTLESVSGALSVAGATAFSLIGPATGTYGLIQLNPNGTYTYTLTRRVDNLPHANDGKEVELAREIFTYQASDANGNTVQGTITVDIVDDTPIARPDSNAVNEGGFVSGEVLPNDGWGADGPDGGVIGVRAANGNFGTPVSGGLETTIQGLYGTLVMGADGEYDYQAGSVDADVTDVFVYTIRDRDGDLSTTTLSIRITNIEEPPPPEHVPPMGGDTVALTVLEAALDEEATGNDIAPGSVVGSTPVEITETDVAPNELTFTAGTDAFTSIGFALVAQQTISVAGLEPGFSITWVLNSGVLIGTLVDGVTPVGEAIRLQLSDNTGPFAAGGTSNVTVTATLTGPLEHVNLPAGQGNVVISGIRVVTAEADGQSVAGTATVTVIDDVPLINVVDNDATDDDIVTVIEGGSTNGVWTLNPGADGVTTVDVTVGNDTQTLDLSDSNDEAVFNLAAGDLTVGAGGTWSFIANTNLTQPVSVSFTLSAVDGDNDPTTDTLTIDIDDGGSPSVSGKAELVLYESGLDTGAPGSGDDDSLDIAPGSVEGTLPDQTTETEVDSNAITYTAGSDDITSIGFAAGASQAPTVSGLEPGYSLTWTNSGTSLLIGTLIGPGNTNLGEAIRVELSGAALSGITAGGSGSITVKATLTGPLEHDYDAILQGPVTIEGLEIVSAEADLESKSGFIDITVHDDNPIMTLEDTSVPDLITDDDDVDVPGSDTKDFSGLFSWIAGADGYDGGTEASGVVFSLSVTGFVANTTFPDSGLDDVATGKNVLLRVNGSGTIDGFIDNGDTTTTVVFTIAISNAPDATWGDVTLTQLRAIKHDNPNDPDEDVGAGAEQMTNVAGGLIKLTATITDGDKDTDSESVDITGAFNFEDDGPTVTATGTAPVLVLDESAAGTDPDGPGLAAAGTSSVTSSASFGTLFSAVNYGEDGAGTVAYTLELSANGIGSGLYALGAAGAQGSEIQLTKLANGSVVGHIGDPTVAANVWFTISVNNTAGPDFGKVTFAQAKNVWHASTASDDDAATLTLDGAGEFLRLRQTVTDNDGDSASDVVNLSGKFTIEDDGPAAGSNATVYLDDETAATTHGTPNLGGTDDYDGITPAPAISGTLAHDFGTDGAGSVLLTGVTGTVVLGANPLGALGTFEHLVTNSGQTLEIYQVQLVGAVNTAVKVITMTVTPATGAYSVTHNATIDHPTPGVPEESQTFTVGYRVTDGDNDTADGSIVIDVDDDTPIFTADVQDQEVSSDPAGAAATGTLYFSPGADGAGPVGAITMTPIPGLTSNGGAVLTHQIGNVLWGYVEAGAADGGIYTPGQDTPVFSLTVNPTAGTSGQYVFDLIGKLDGGLIDVNIATEGAFGNGPSDSVIVTVDTTEVVFVTGWTPQVGFDEAGWYAGGIPALNQSSSLQGSSAGWGLGNNNFDNGEFIRFDFGALDDYDGAGSYTPPGATGPMASVQYATVVASNQFNSGDVIKFVAHYTDGSIEAFTMTHGTNGPSKTFTAPAGQQIAWIDAYGSAGTIKLDLGVVGFRSEEVDQDLTFQVTLSDDDGDTVQSDTFIVNVVDGGTPLAVAPPIVLDLDGDGAEFLSLDAGVTYNYGFGLVATAWVGADDGLLARQTASGLDVVFADDAPGANTDLEGLRLAHDSNADGVFDASDVSFGQFGVWRDANSDGVVDAGEFTSLAGAGISAINLVSDGKGDVAANGDVTIHGMGTFVRADGSIGRLADVSFAISAERANTRSIEFAGVAAAAGAISALTAPVLLASDNDGPAASTDALGLGEGGSSAPGGAQDDADLANIAARLQSNLETSSARSESIGTAGSDDSEGPAGLYDAGNDNDAAPASAGAADADNPAVGPDASLFAGDAAGMEAMNALLTMAPVNSAPEADEAPAGLAALQEAVAEAGQDSLAEQLVAQFASADEDAGPPMSGTDLAHLLAISVSEPGTGGMPAYDMNQQLADEAHALAAAG